MIDLSHRSSRTHEGCGPAAPFCDSNPLTNLLHATFIWIAGSALLGLVTWACYKSRLDKAHVECIFLVAMVLLSLVDGFLSSIVFCLTAILCIDFFFTEPRFSLHIPSNTFLADVTTFLLPSLVITALVRHARSLARVQREQARLLDLTQDAIVVRDMNGVVTYWNRGATRLYGWNKHEVLDQNIHDLLGTRLPDRMEDITEALLTTGHWEGELIRRRRDGSEAIISSRWSLKRSASGQPLATLESGNDITARKHAEDALKQSEAVYFTEAQKLSGTGNFGWDVQSGQGLWSEQTFRIFEYSFDVIPTLDLVMLRVHPDDIQTVRDMISQAAAARHSLDFEYRLLMPNGSVKYLHVVAHVTRSDRLQYAGAIMDVTSARQTQLHLQDARCELARITRVTMLGELSASIAHEVSQPLSAIAMTAEASLRWLGHEPVRLAEVQTNLARIIDETRRSAEIIKRVRALARQDAGERVPLNINDVVNEVVSLIHREFSRHDVPLRLQLARPLPLLLGDRIQLQQVMINLIMNGIQSMDGVANRPRELSIESRVGTDGNVVVAVRDSGIGISASNADRLFDAFFTTKPQGMGMGLSICRSIIEAHEGSIAATNNDGYGATFECTLPPLRE